MVDEGETTTIVEMIVNMNANAGNAAILLWSDMAVDMRRLVTKGATHRDICGLDLLSRRTRGSVNRTPHARRRVQQAGADLDDGMINPHRASYLASGLTFPHRYIEGSEEDQEGVCKVLDRYYGLSDTTTNNNKPNATTDMVYYSNHADYYIPSPYKKPSFVDFSFLLSFC
ncbi:hypothetical protein K439DRAFT_1613820 [Ramaria rubella]|nr:hypothetical protein K439DRAFT_1613820 [Ramaria rubella]